MRANGVAALAAVLTVFTLTTRGAAQSSEASARDLARARTLDHEGARAFREGRYNDAIRYFDDAYKLGAPSTELWNVARCHLKLDEPEEASDALERYLAIPDLTAGDRAEAKAQLEELRRRHSILTVTSAPTGARVSIDGRRVGRTPLSVDLAPGEHTVRAEHDDASPYVEHVKARFGRAVIVDAQLQGTPDSRERAVPTSPGEVTRVRRFLGVAELGVLWSRLGRFSGVAHPAGLVSLGYAFHDDSRVIVAAGMSATVTEDTWSNGVGAPEPAGCNVSTNERAAALSAFVDGTVGYRASHRIRIDGDFGVGLASYFVKRAGGDLFNPTCSASTGLRPALHVGGALSYALGQAVRIVLSPIVLEIQPAFGDARSSPLDAAGPWLRFGGALGFALDL